MISRLRNQSPLAAKPGTGFPNLPSLPIERFERTPSESLGWKPYALVALTALGGLSGCVQQGTTLQLPQRTPVATVGRQVLYVPPSQSFHEPQDWSHKRLHLEVTSPHPGLVVSLQATDDHGHRQSTRWTEGQGHQLEYRPSRAEVDEQGRTDEGFDPSRIRSIRLLLSPARELGWSKGELRVASQQLVNDITPQSAAKVRPLLRKSPGAPTSGALQMGLSRYFVYGDLHQWQRARPLVEETFRQQQLAGHDSFRWMGGLDLRQGQALNPTDFQSMREYLELAERYGQNRQIFTLLDGAIPNPALKEAFRSPEAGARLIETLRPFIREFGNAEVNGQRLIFDLVNEIHGCAGDEASKQKFVENLVEVFIQEAPGATLTVGVQNFRELKYWSYLSQHFQNRPVDFIYSFHVYEPMENLPDRAEFNLPEGARVEITEADPNQGVEQQIRMAREKGYDGLMFWTDAGHPYQPR